MKFEDVAVGDTVRRVNSSHGKLKVGDTGVVDTLDPRVHTVTIVGDKDGYNHHVDNLVLVSSAAKADAEFRETTFGPLPTGEADPTGRAPHEPGAKVDAGKVQPRLIIEGMARALWAVSEVATFGAMKYTPGGWVLVPNGRERYADAGYRHVLKRAIGEDVDPDSKLQHLAHEAWNALAKLDLAIREQEKALP